MTVWVLLNLDVTKSTDEHIKLIKWKWYLCFLFRCILCCWHCWVYISWYIDTLLLFCTQTIKTCSKTVCFAIHFFFFSLFNFFVESIQDPPVWGCHFSHPVEGHKRQQTAWAWKHIFHCIFLCFRFSTLYLNMQMHAGFNNHQQGTNTALFFVGLMEVNSAH